MTKLEFAFLSRVGVALLLSGMSTCTDTQTGFVNMDCGIASAAYEDGVSTLTSSKDTAYVFTGTNADLKIAVNSTMDNYLQLQTLGYFPANRRKAHAVLRGTPTASKKSASSTGLVVGAVIDGLPVLVIALGILTYYLGRRLRKTAKGSPERLTGFDSPPNPDGPIVGKVCIETVLVATSNYAKKIGEGSYGSMYQGFLYGKEVAVKVNNTHSDQGFINEGNNLTRVHQKNLVTFLGYCNEGKQLILIYEYQAKGTLQEWVYGGGDKKPLRGFRSWERRLAFELVRCVGVVLVLLAVCTRTHAQSAQFGFVTIDCGYSGSPYFDDLGLQWSGDENYVLTGINAANISLDINSTVPNYQALGTLRYFPEKRSKHCYELPTSNSTTLIRAMFLQGNSSALILPIQFNVSVNATNWFSVQYGNDDNIDTLNTPLVFEAALNSLPGSVAHFCLLPVMGVPFISSLEVRPYSSLWVAPDAGQFLWTVLRLNPGALPDAPTVRYPDEGLDKFWTTPYSADNNIPSYTTTGTSGTPRPVMDNAWLNDAPNTSFSPKSLASLYTPGAVDGSTGGKGALYLEDISPNATDSSIRGMSVLVNGGGGDVNITKDLVLVYQFSVLAVPTLNFTFEALPSSALGPLVNAMEVYNQFKFDDATTDGGDVAALMNLQTSFNLTSWQGDPCFPVPWNWVYCQNMDSFQTGRILKILLSNMGIIGSIPSNISQLSALTEIHLDNNSLNGEIPPSLGNLQYLTVLLLNNNDLDGEVPDDLQNKKGLNFTYFGNSLLELGQPPSPGPGPTTSNFKKSTSNTGLIVGGAIGGVLVLLIAVSILTWYLWPRKTAKGYPDSDSYGQTVGKVSLETLLVATNNYAEKVGVGSYGSVYKGSLNGKEIAVKVNNSSSQRNQEFLNEVDILTRVHHKNLVTLLGYCNEGQQLILIYEYQANGTLQEWVHGGGDKKPVRGFLSWDQRLQIAVDAAKGLEYLHKDCVPSIIHRDVKSNNILLDSKLVGKVADFGVSKIIMHGNDKSTVTGLYTDVKGTYGYLDPEYFQTFKLTHKSDVYGLGVVLAELITGRPPFEQLEDGSFRNIIDVVQTFVQKADIQSVADPSLHNNFDVESLWRMADIIVACVQPKGEDRPDITEVVRHLEDIRSTEKNWLQVENS